MLHFVDEKEAKKIFDAFINSFPIDHSRRVKFESILRQKTAALRNYADFLENFYKEKKSYNLWLYDADSASFKEDIEIIQRVNESYIENDLVSRSLYSTLNENIQKKSINTIIPALELLENEDVIKIVTKNDITGFLMKTFTELALNIPSEKKSFLNIVNSAKNLDFKEVEYFIKLMKSITTEQKDEKIISRVCNLHTKYKQDFEFVRDIILTLSKEYEGESEGSFESDFEYSTLNELSKGAKNTKSPFEDLRNKSLNCALDFLEKYDEFPDVSILLLRDLLDFASGPFGIKDSHSLERKRFHLKKFYCEFFELYDFFSDEVIFKMNNERIQNYSNEYAFRNFAYFLYSRALDDPSLNPKTALEFNLNGEKYWYFENGKYLRAERSQEFFDWTRSESELYKSILSSNGLDVSKMSEELLKKMQKDFGIEKLRETPKEPLSELLKVY